MDALNTNNPSGAMKAARVVGVHGSTLFARLPYVDLQNVWIVPICHALLYGVVKDFVSTFLEGG